MKCQVIGCRKQGKKAKFENPFTKEICERVICGYHDHNELGYTYHKNKLLLNPVSIDDLK